MGYASDANEVVQDGLCAVSRRIDTFGGEAIFSSWVTANTAYQKLRTRRSKAKELSWEDLSRSLGENRRHVGPAFDGSPRAKRILRSGPSCTLS